VRSGGATPPEEYFERFLSRPENTFIVATDGGQPVGYVVAYLVDRIDRDQRMMFLYEIGVAETHRRRGIGRNMIDTLKSVCREANAVKMWVPTGRSNIAATRLYASTGGVPLSSVDEVTYTYPRESFAGAS
jgi:ribosomal protein S18 acetylase RimI-like enzyme